MSRPYPRLHDMNQYEREKFNELRRMLNQGRLPVYLINPSIILSHNEASPDVAKLDEKDIISLDRLIVLVAGCSEIGINARASMRRALRTPMISTSKPDHVEVDNPKLHAMLDAKED